MSRHIVNVRGWPGLDGWRPPPEATEPERLQGSTARFMLIVAALPDRDAPTDQLGLGAYLLAADRTVIRGGLITPNDLDARDRNARRRLRAFARRRPLDDVFGPRPWEVLTASDFGRSVLARHAYTGLGWIVGADLGRTLGLIAETWGPSRNPVYRGGWSLGLPGWGATVTTESGCTRWSDNTGRARLNIAATSVQSLRGGFNNPRQSFDGEPRGPREPTVDGGRRVFRGRILELCGPASAFDAVEVHSVARHSAAFGIEPIDTGPIRADAEGATLVAGLVRAAHQLALAIDHDAEWFGVAIGGLHSTGTLSTRLAHRAGLGPPLARLALDADEMDHWCATLHGGLVDAHPTASLVPVADVDIRSAHPRVARLLGIWPLLAAESVGVEDVTDAFRTFVAAPDSLEALRHDPGVWARWGCTRVVVRAAGEPFPVEIDTDKQVGRLTMTALHADRWDTTWCDVMAAARLSGHAPEIISAYRLVPQGHTALRQLKVPDFTCEPGDDLFAAMLTARRAVKTRAEQARIPPRRVAFARQAARIRLVANSLVGQLARFDANGETDRPGPWAYPPAASCIYGATRLLVLMLDADVHAAGGIVLATDTDGSHIGASPTGDEPITTVDGVTGRALSWEHLDTITDTYRPLAPDDPDGLFTINREHDGRPLVGRIFGAKRWTVGTRDRHGRYAFTAGTEHVIGVYEPPPTMRDLRGKGRRAWTAEVARVLATHDFTNPTAVVPAFGWEHGTGVDFPALERRRATHSDDPHTAKVMRVLGLRPAGGWIEAKTDSWTDAQPVARDPGGDLADWQDVAWYDLTTEERIHVTTDATDATAVPVRTLRDVAVSWARPQPRDTPAVVHVDPALIRIVGRIGATVYTDNGIQPVVTDIDPAAILTDVAQRLGPTRFAAQTGIPLRTAKRIATGGHARPATIARALAALDTPTVAGLLDHAPIRGCDHCGNALTARQRRWCSAPCKHQGSRTPTNARRVIGDSSTPGGTESNAARNAVPDD